MSAPPSPPSFFPTTMREGGDLVVYLIDFWHNDLDFREIRNWSYPRFPTTLSRFDLLSWQPFTPTTLVPSSFCGGLAPFRSSEDPLLSGTEACFV